MTNEEREKEIRKLPIPTEEECIAFYKDLVKLADVRFVPYYKMAIKALEQQSCEDCISSTDLIAAMHLIMDDAKIGDNDEDYESLDDIKQQYIEIVKGMVSVKPEVKWIPVSERLPNAYEFVNCTCHSLIDDREDWVIETVYIPQPSYSPYSDWGNIPMLNSGDCKVVAWMHRDIPEPYKAESEVNNDEDSD